jgi:hypothetical protein
LNYLDDSYDVVTCVGTPTHGHVRPVPALSEFVLIVKKVGIVVATVLDDIWQYGGYEAEVERLETDNLVDVVSAEKADFRRGAGVQAIILVLEEAVRDNLGVKPNRLDVFN